MVSKSRAIKNTYSVYATTATTRADLTQYSVISNANTSGFNTEGNCGYVAGALIVWYHYKVLGWTGFVPSGVFNNSLVKSIQGNRDNDTTGPDLQASLSIWSRDHGAVNGTTETLPALCDLLPSASTVFELIRDNRPVILLGLIYDPRTDSTSNVQSDIQGDGSGKVQHAITVTGVVKETSWLIFNDYHYWAHYGWGKEYNEVYVDESAVTKGAAVYY